MKFWILIGNCYIINILQKNLNDYITKVCKYEKKANNSMYELFGEFLRVLPLKFCFRMIF